MGGGTAAVRPAERSFGLRSRPPAISCSHGREGLTHWLNFDVEGMRATELSQKKEFCLHPTCPPTTLFLA